jgi:peptidoglycan-associated lipoprotein
MIKILLIWLSVALLSSCGNTIVKEGSAKKNVVVIEERLVSSDSNTRENIAKAEKGYFKSLGTQSEYKESNNVSIQYSTNDSKREGNNKEKEGLLVDAANGAVLDLKDIGVKFVLYFPFNEFEISAKNNREIIKHANFMRENPRLKLHLEGHADERGTREYNLALGENRALSVKEVLGLYGLLPRVKVVSFGEERAIDFEHNEEAWRQNRRVEFVYK